MDNFSGYTPQGGATTIRELCKERGLTLEALATRSGVGLENLKKMKRRPIKKERTRRELAEKLAQALEVDVEVVLNTDELRTAPEQTLQEHGEPKTTPSYQPRTGRSSGGDDELIQRDKIVGGLAEIGDSAGKGAIQTVHYKLRTHAQSTQPLDRNDAVSAKHGAEQSPPPTLTKRDLIKRLLARGDKLYGKGWWEDALAPYEKVSSSLVRGSFEWSEVSVERLARTMAVMGRLDEAQRIVEEVEERYLERLTEAGEEPDPLIRALCAEKRGWIARYRGLDAAPYFIEAMNTARELGMGTFAATSQHMVGRVLIEEAGIRRFYPKVFPGVPTSKSDLHYALQQVQQAKEEGEGSDEATTFGIRWEGLGLVLTGNYYEGMRSIRGAIQQFGASAHGDYVWRDRVRIEVLRARSAWELKELSAELGEIYSRSASKKHPYATAEALASLLYAEFLTGSYKVDKVMRQRVADLATLTLMLHPYPNHTFYQVAAVLLRMCFLPAMAEAERREYLAELPYRVAEGQGCFIYLKRLGLAQSPFPRILQQRAA